MAVSHKHAGWFLSWQQTTGWQTRTALFEKFKLDLWPNNCILVPVTWHVLISSYHWPLMFMKNNQNTKHVVLEMWFCKHLYKSYFRWLSASSEKPAVLLQGYRIHFYVILLLTAFHARTQCTCILYRHTFMLILTYVM